MWIGDERNAACACAMLRRRFETMSEADSRAVYATLADAERGSIMSISRDGVEEVSRIRDLAIRRGYSTPEPSCIYRELLAAAQSGVHR